MQRYKSWVLERIHIPVASWELKGVVSNEDQRVMLKSEMTVGVGGEESHAQFEAGLKIGFLSANEDTEVGFIKLVIYLDVHLEDISFEEKESNETSLREFANEMTQVITGYARAQILRIVHEASLPDLILPITEYTQVYDDVINRDEQPNNSPKKKTRKNHRQNRKLKLQP